MTPKFIREVHKTTIDLLRQLAAIREMTNISVHIKNKPSTQPISLGYRTEQKNWEHHGDISISTFLSFDIQTAIAAGGSIDDLLASKKRRPLKWDMEPLETDTVEQALRTVGFKEAKTDD
jgi:hypothetical protein